MRPRLLKKEKNMDILQKYIESTGGTCAFYRELLGEDYKNSPKYTELRQAVKAGTVIENKKGEVTFPYIDEMERNIAIYAIAHLHYDEERRKKYSPAFCDMFIDEYERSEGGKIKLDVWQREAVYTAMNNNLFILTGGPGTGKTCVLKCINYVLEHTGQSNVQFTAPTGKAARRITESTGKPACTLHKKMKLHDEFSKPSMVWCDALIVDEISMLDTWTAMNLFKAVTDSTKLILVGDVEQLPSVGFGSVLRDLIDANLPCVKLEKTFRQASESGLFANIIEVKKGLKNGFVERDDFVIVKANAQTAKKEMIKAFLSEVEEWGLDNVVCLTPYRRVGEACAIKMNEALQNALNPVQKGKRFLEKEITEEDGFQYKCRFQVDDPVMQLVNTSTVANGDVGKVIKVFGDKLVVKFIDCEVAYKYEDLDQLTLAYAMSVHKSQGSEYKSVITSAIESDMGMLSRNTIYTAITRSKQKCVIISEGDVAKRACEIESGYERHTGLTDKIEEQELTYQTLLSIITY